MTLAARKRSARQNAIQWARDLLGRDDWVIVDVETSGLREKAEIVQVGVLGAAGEALLDQLVKPTHPIPAAATAIHGIRDADVVDAPRFGEIYMPLIELLANKLVVAYNADFDRRMMMQEYRRGNYAVAPPPARQWACAMLRYAAFYGDWDRRRGSFRWQKLTAACARQKINISGAHSALGDCKLTLALIQKMAAAGDAD